MTGTDLVVGFIRHFETYEDTSGWHESSRLGRREVKKSL